MILSVSYTGSNQPSDSLSCSEQNYEIQKEQVLVFAYGPSSQNSVDFATRSLTVAEITDCSLWWHGPEWLQLWEETWPKWNLPSITPGDWNTICLKPKWLDPQ